MIICIEMLNMWYTRRAHTNNRIIFAYLADDIDFLII